MFDGGALGKFALLLGVASVDCRSAWSPFGNMCVVSSTAAMAYEGGILEIAQTEGSVWAVKHCARASSITPRFLAALPACRLHRDKAIGRGAAHRSWSLWSDHRSSVQR